MDAHWSGYFVAPCHARTESAPAGPAALPPPSSVLHGLTAQSEGGVRLPISLTATHSGKVWANWDATMNCRPGTFAMTNVTPITQPGHRFRPCSSGKQAWAARG